MRLRRRQHRLRLRQNPAGVDRLPLAAAFISASSGTETQSSEASRDAISKSVYLLRPPSAELGAPSSTRYKNSGDCKIADTAYLSPTRMLPPGSLAMSVATLV